MKRRTFIKHNAILFGAMPFMSVNSLAAFYKHDNSSSISKINIGKIKCTILKDKMHTYTAARYFSNAAPEELTQALNKYHLQPNNIPSPFIAMLLEVGNRKVLIDTGLGFAEKPVLVNGSPLELTGQLHQLFQQEKIKQSDITDVIITHFHPDHIGGIYSEQDQMLFPNARFHLHQNEWDYWHSSKADSQPAVFKYMVEKNVSKLKTKDLNLIAGDFVEVLPGITVVKAEGHTPGQIAVIIQSDGNKLLYISDAFLHPLHIEKLDWQTNYDLDHTAAKASRIKLLDLALKENMLINAFHFDFPGLGRVDKQHNNWHWTYTSS